MEFKLVLLLGFLFMAGLAMANDEFNEYEADTQNDETKTTEKKETASDEEKSNDEEPKMVMEDMNAQTSMALTQNDDPDAIKHKGYCHWGIAVWFKPGFAQRCGCMKCICKTGGNWACAYEFAYCPYYYCGNQIYNPYTQICCCGKAHTKKTHYACCGYFYYHTKVSQCCNYYSVKPKKVKCPRYRV